MSKNYMDMKKTQIAGAIAASAVLALALFFVAMPNTVHADDWSSGGDYTSGGFCDSCDLGGSTGGWTSGGDYTTQGTCDSCSLGTSGWTSGGDYTTQGTCDTCGYTGGYTSGGYTPSYGGYSTGGGYTSGGYSFPMSTLGGGYGGGSSLSNSNTNVNTNYCTNGSCNTAINAPTNIVTNNPAPQTIVYAQPSYPIYNTPVYIPSGPSVYDICPNIVGIQASLPTGYYMQNGNCFYNAAPVQPIQPYVTLAAVPYTGLDLGPVGTALYWGFLVLWCLIAAYLIAVKKVQNKIAAWFTSDASHTTTVVAHTAPAVHVAPAQFHSIQFDGIDPFIQAQINRTK